MIVIVDDVSVIDVGFAEDNGDVGEGGSGGSVKT